MPDSDGTGLESVRPMTEADLPRCRELAAQAAREGSGTDGSGGASVGAERITLVGCFAGTVVGLAAAHLEDRRGERLGVLDGCYVEPAARGVGVGGALLERIVSWVDEHGGRATEAHARPGDRSTKRLLEAAGFATRELILRHSSSSRPGPGIRPGP